MFRNFFFRFRYDGYCCVRLEDVVNSCGACKEASHANSKAYDVTSRIAQYHVDFAALVAREEMLTRESERMRLNFDLNQKFFVFFKSQQSVLSSLRES